MPHSFIYEFSGNPLIAETMRLNWHHLRRGMGQVLRFVPAAGVWNEHASILEAMAEGDAETAAELMRRHLVDAQDRVRTMAGASPS
jgi:DNA-binding GntR family transcriptional regulator